MTIESWQVGTRAAELYEKLLVPALTAAWAPLAIEAAGVRPGDHVLDVACGTGVVARAAAERAGPAGRVVGLDLNPGMLAVARTLGPEIEWRQGDAAALPFPDASFDRVTCQFALMFFPDRAAALREMRRVLKPNGWLAIATWGPIDVSPPYAMQAEIAGRLAGPEAAAIVFAPFVLTDPAELELLLADAGFAESTAETRQETVMYSNVDAFLEGEVDATPLGAFLLERSQALYDQVKAELREAVAPYTSATGVMFPIDANVASARQA
jgi:ubiquinone/menaquinone biosynthesis C-methylase UbiE